MAVASFPTIELSSFNDAIFSAISEIQHILKQGININGLPVKSKTS